MATIPSPVVPPGVDYPDSDGQPMAETPVHRRNMTNTIESLDIRFADDPWVYVSGNMFIYYVPGDRLRHVSPDVFVVRGVPKIPERRRYLVWEEHKGPDLAIEITSPSTREEDLDDKFQIYQDTLRIREYFLFDPYAEYLDPPLRGYRLQEGCYVQIQEVDGRLPSEVLGLHLERSGSKLRLYDPATCRWPLTPSEQYGARLQAEAARHQAEAARQQAEATRQRETNARQQAEAEVERLRRELEALRGQLPKQQ